MMFVWERDFRQKVCFAIMPGSCHWDEVEQVHGQAGCLDGQRLGVREGAAGARLLQEAEGENHCHLVPPGGCREDGPRLFSEVQESTRCKSLKGQESTPWQLATRQVLIRQKGKQNSQEGDKALEQVVKGSGGLPSLGFFRSGWDKFLSNLIWWHLCWAGGWTGWPPEVHSNLNYSVVLNIVCGSAKFDFGMIKITFEARARAGQTSNASGTLTQHFQKIQTHLHFQWKLGYSVALRYTTVTGLFQNHSYVSGCAWCLDVLCKGSDLILQVIYWTAEWIQGFYFPFCDR